MENASPNYYLGRIFDPKTKSATNEPVLLDPANLTTHAVITGMTGSGKTGLGIGLLEEAALHGLPAIIIDPKGDLTNLVLHFPDLLSSDFEPWIDPEMAKREGKTVAELAEITSANWKKGLADWGLGTEQLKALGENADFAIYTPGSASGIPVNILSSFQAPELDWESNSEVLRERISSTVTALLGLIGISDIDPLRSREHILLSNLLETAWMNKQSLTLTDLILQVQNPPMDRLGAFPMDSFFPEKDRFDLALQLNNFLASPSFQVWQQGQVLDIGAMQRSDSGKPRHSIFYIAHLSENERMFFVTLLFAAVESWMRGQRGTGNLRTIVYFDEIMGYLPPVANPASKTVMLRMLKQARAFGVGLVLATQNPVDVDYKALSNAGTWMIGRLQTEQDKQRLLDGLSSAGGTTDVATLDKMISGLGKRVFLYHSIYKSGPVLFNTRWALNYLAGPMTRDQIPMANELVSAAAPKAGKKAVQVTQGTLPPVADEKPAASVAASSGVVSSRPAIQGDIPEYFMPNNLGFSQAAAAAGLPSGASSLGLVYHTALFLQSEVRYLSRQYNIESSRKVSAFLEDPGTGLIKWEKLVGEGIDTSRLETQPLPRSQFRTPPGWLGDSRKTADIEKDFADWLYRTASQRIKANSALKVYSTPEMTDMQFQEKCREAAKTAIETEKAKVTSTYTTKIAAMERKIDSQELDVKAATSQVSQRNIEQFATGGAAVLSMLTGRKRSLNSTISKVRMASAAKDKLAAEEETLSQYKEQLVELQKLQADALKEVEMKWEAVINKVSEVTISPTKSDIFSEAFGVAWVPYYLVENAGKKLEIPAFAK